MCAIPLLRGGRLGSGGSTAADAPRNALLRGDLLTGIWLFQLIACWASLHGALAEA